MTGSDRRDATVLLARGGSRGAVRALALPAPGSVRTVVAAVFALLCCLVSLAQASSSETRDISTLDFNREVKPLLESYCYQCHGGESTKGDLDLKRHGDVRAIQLDAVTWLDAKRMLDENEMPPTKAKKQPSAEERARLSAWIKYAVDSIDPALVVKDPGAVVLHRLNKTEFDNTYRDLLAIKPGLAKDFPDDIGGNSGFDNSADSLSSPSLFIEKVLAAATEGLNQATLARLFVRMPQDTTPAKEQRDLARENLAAFVARAWRRPAKARELDQLLLIFDLYTKKKNQAWESAMRQVYRQVLTSPAFIYRAEEVRPSERGPYEIGQYDMANRLSYFLWSSMPDDALLALAADGSLHKPEVIAQQVQRMLADPKADTFGDRFVGQWLDTAALRRGGGPDPKVYPAFTEQMRESMCDEPGQFFKGLLAGNGSLLELIDSDYVYVNEDTARIYDIRGVSGREFRKVPRPGADRGGIIAMPAVLTLTSYPRRTSPVLRGAWVLTNLLNAPPPPPPPNVPTLDEVKVTANVGASAKEPSVRDRLTAHRADAACASCHSRIDPIGFGLENYDAMGSFRARDEHGNVLDTKGTLLTGETFSGAAELKQVLMKRSDAFVRLVVEQMLAYALGRKLEPFDRPTVGELTRNLIADKYRVRGLVLGIANSYPMRFKRNQKILAPVATGESR